MKALVLAACLGLAACDTESTGFPARVPTSGGGICALGTATSASGSAIISGSLVSNDCQLSPTDARRADFYRLTVTTGQSLVIVMASTAFSPVFNVYNAAGGIVSVGDTANTAASDSLTLGQLTPGTYYVAATP